MFRKILLIIALFLGMNAIGYAETDKKQTDKSDRKVLEVNVKRMVRVIGEVDQSIMDDANQLEALSAQSKDPIYIVINSPGGSVSFGMQFLTAMKVAKSRDVKLVCVVPNLAASMAFHMLAECDERYALSYTLLLWHPMKTGGMFVMLSADQMEYLVKTMRSWEVPLNDKIMKQLNLSKDLFYYHYTHETLFIPSQLAEIAPNFITIIDEVKGVPNLFKMKKEPNPFDARKTTAPKTPGTQSPIPSLIEDNQ